MEWIDPQDDDQTPAPSEIQSRSVYAGQDSHRPAPVSQQRLADLPVSTMSDVADMFFLYDNT